MTRKRYVQDPQTGKLVPRELYRRHAAPESAAVMPDIAEFVSPVTGERIGSRSTLREHNREHGVVQHGEFGENEGRDYFGRRQSERLLRLRGQTRRDREERLAAIIPIVEANER